MGGPREHFGHLNGFRHDDDKKETAAIKDDGGDYFQVRKF